MLTATWLRGYVEVSQYPGGRKENLMADEALLLTKRKLKS
jgi:hypothetical protein